MNYAAYPNNPIDFPGLGVSLNPSPVAFNLFGHDFYWYGIIIAVGFLLAAIYCMKRAPKLGLSTDNLLDCLIFAVPVSVIFARLYYCVFNPSLFTASAENPTPQKVWEIWNGGLAIYGAIIGAALTTVVYCRVKKIKLGNVLDVGSLGLLIGQCIGRWGNFFNREAFGSETSLPWRMEVFVDKIGDKVYNMRLAVHPTFIYESIWNFIGFLLLSAYSKKRKFEGEVFLLYIAWYGLGRGFIEGMRADSLMFFGTNLRVSQFVGFLTFILGLAAVAYVRIFKLQDYETPVYGAPLTVAETEDTTTSDDTNETSEAKDTETPDAPSAEDTNDDETESTGDALPDDMDTSSNTEKTE